MVSTLDSESNNPSSNLGRTSFLATTSSSTSFLPTNVLLQDVRRSLHRLRIVVVHKSTRPCLLLTLQNLNRFRQQHILPLQVTPQTYLRYRRHHRLLPQLRNHHRSHRLLLLLHLLNHWRIFHCHRLNCSRRCLNRRRCRRCWRLHFRRKYIYFRVLFFYFSLEIHDEIVFIDFPEVKRPIFP